MRAMKHFGWGWKTALFHYTIGNWAVRVLGPYGWVEFWKSPTTFRPFLQLFRYGFTPFRLAVQSSIGGPIEDMSAHQGEILVTGGRSISLFKVSMRSSIFAKHPDVDLSSIPILLFPFEDVLPSRRRANTAHICTERNIIVITFVDSFPFIVNSIM